jgi:outer membrane biosynthesis protein TonB
LRDHAHIFVDNSDVCAHCGQPLPAAVPTYAGDKRTRRTGLIVTVLLHLLLIAVYLFQPSRTEKHARPPAGGAIVWIAPQQPKPKAKPQEQAPKKTAKPSKPRPAPERIQVQRLPNTITLPNEKPAEVAKEEPKKSEPLPPEMDMQAYIEARRKQRGAPTPSQAEETDQARGMRNALANISAINARGRDDSNESGGVFSISNKTFHSMDLKFRGWNPSFKRRWLTQATVEQGGEPDVETAVVKKMIELIRKEKTGDFEWDSHRLGRVMTMSARVKDTAELQAFLFKEMFPEYKPPRQ